MIIIIITIIILIIKTKTKIHNNQDDLVFYDILLNFLNDKTYFIHNMDFIKPRNKFKNTKS